MTILYGTAIAACLCLLMITAGYALAGFLSTESRLTRLAIANLAGLAWILFGASVLGALTPLQQPTVWLLWTPVLLTALIPTTRGQLRSDFQALRKSPQLIAALAGVALLWLALLLPFLVFPDLAFFDGKSNHDNFFWCVGAGYLQSHDYMTFPPQSHDYPLYNTIKAFIGWHPVWGRMGAEGFIAATSSTVGRPAIQLYNFLVSSLIVPWLLTVLAIARLLGLPRLDRLLLGLVCFCQPVLYFFIANGNLPNFLGAIFSGGLWLLILLVGEARQRHWPIAAVGILCVHGILCCYPEIMAFALIPVGLLVGWRLLQATPGRMAPLLLLIIIIMGGLCLNPLTTARTWNGMLNSINQVRQDQNWANIFSRISYAGYVPSLVTLAMPSVRIIGGIGGTLASIGVLFGGFFLFKNSPQRIILLISLSGFATLILYTVATSFSYGWQKSAQFFGIQLAVLFPVLIAGTLQNSLRGARPHRLIQLSLLATLVVLALGTFGNTLENLKSSRTKGLTQPLLALRTKVATEFPGQPILIDGATFSAGFFHSMWAPELFARNPVVFLPRQDQAGGYLRDSVTLANPTSQASSGLYYVAAEWAQAFDYQPVPLEPDRVGVLLRQHNLITEFSGFYRPSGVPVKAAADFSLTIFPYADGWLEFTLTPNGEPSNDCRIQGSATTEVGEQQVTATLNAQQQLIVLFPLKAGTRNHLSAHISGAPPLVSVYDAPPYPFNVINVQSTRLP